MAEPLPPQKAPRRAVAAWPTASTKPCLAPGYHLLWPDGSDAATLNGAGAPVQLNATATAILRRCDGVRNVRRMVSELERAFDAVGIAAEVHAFLRQSRERGWLR